MARRFAFGLLGCMLSLAVASAGMAPGMAAEERAPATGDRRAEDEVIYFLMPDRFANGDPSNDRGGLSGGPRATGYDPTHKGFYHGGDLRGVRDHLDYIAALGATAIWVTPIFANKPVQGADPWVSAGYHGYWITDFTRVDPHLGTNADFKALVEAAHARGMKVYTDIVTNHTADVIHARECTGRAECPYRPLSRPAYTPVVPAAEAHIKVPAWLNDPALYHNRGNSTFRGESSLYGDFSGLDDLDTGNPRVIEGMIAIYRDWITTYRIDGFRIDTARHVDDVFWRRFLPAILDHAKAVGIPDFYIFGEVAHPEPGYLARYVRDLGMPAALDFPFAYTIQSVLAQEAATARLAALFETDDLYTAPGRGAARLPVFNGNHDMGRFAHFLLAGAGKDAPDALLRRRVEMAHALLFFARGIPVIYYGDEQGFTGDGGDQDAREDMFESSVRTYNDNRLIGSTATTAGNNFDPGHPLYRALAAMARVYHAERGLRRGVQIVRHFEDTAGLFALSRIDWEARREYLFLLNTAQGAGEATIPVAADGEWRRLIGEGAASLSSEERRIAVSLPAHSYAVYRAGAAIPRPAEAPDLACAGTTPAGGGARYVAVASAARGPLRVHFALEQPDGTSVDLGTDASPPYRVVVAADRVARDAPAMVVAMAEDLAGHRTTVRCPL